mmetsp:Transcript_15958/g.23901  ORF Transcript_15958/g.23901 Transcript_15958/m.23901 type:complete len:397 (+) Transcript_15958:197-1387(+)
MMNKGERFSKYISTSLASLILFSSGNTSTSDGPISTVQALTVGGIGISKINSYSATTKRQRSSRLFDNADEDANRWISTDETYDPQWEDEVMKRQDESTWSNFNSTGDEYDKKENNGTVVEDEDMEGEAWLDALANVAADEINFIYKEADRADQQRQMQEWGFEADTIANTLDLAKDESSEIDETNEVFEAFKEETAKSGFGMYLDDDEDLETVESHTKVERDEDSGDPIRTQMVYVDEVSCIGCTNCAMIAQSTFFMEQEMGRARVFQQWGDDDETVQIAIETCPVDCIYYVPYEELVGLEVERRDQSINSAARLVNQSDVGGSGGSKMFTGPQEISGNMGSRCNNCPSRGCKDCPMFGVGKSPYFEAKEKDRKERAAKRRMKIQMEDSNRSAEL